MGTAGSEYKDIMTNYSNLTAKIFFKTWIVETLKSLGFRCARHTVRETPFRISLGQQSGRRVVGRLEFLCVDNLGPDIQDFGPYGIWNNEVIDTTK